ncbi:unnamed protein product [Rotaria socialis]
MFCLQVNEEKRISIIGLFIYSIGENILSIFDFFSLPLRYLLPNLNDDEYYLILLNFIITIFAFIYAYLFYIIRLEIFTAE